MIYFQMRALSSSLSVATRQRHVPATRGEEAGTAQPEWETAGPGEGTQSGLALTFCYPHGHQLGVQGPEFSDFSVLLKN